MISPSFTELKRLGEQDHALLTSTLDTVPVHRITGDIVGKVIKCYDADTITLAFRTGPTEPIYKYQIRICFYDAAEMKGGTAAERKLARMARERVNDLLYEKLVIFQPEAAPDKYGRLLGKIWFWSESKTGGTGEWKDIAEELFEANLVNKYSGGTKEGFAKLIELHGLVEGQCAHEEEQLKLEHHKIMAEKAKVRAAAKRKEKYRHMESEEVLVD